VDSQSRVVLSKSAGVGRAAIRLAEAFGALIDALPEVRRSRRWRAPLGAALLLASIGGFALMGLQFRSFLDFDAHALRASGTVIAVKSEVAGEGDYYGYATVRFTSKDGQEHEVTIFYGACCASEGDVVEVLYDPQAPGTTQINSYETRWRLLIEEVVFPLIGLVLGAQLLGRKADGFAPWRAPIGETRMTDSNTERGANLTASLEGGRSLSLSILSRQMARTSRVMKPRVVFAADRAR
jgi:hypothetical protein